MKIPIKLPVFLFFRKVFPTLFLEHIPSLEVGFVSQYLNVFSVGFPSSLFLFFQHCREIKIFQFNYISVSDMFVFFFEYDIILFTIATEVCLLLIVIIFGVRIIESYCSYKFVAVKTGIVLLFSDVSLLLLVSCDDIKVLIL